MHPVEKNVLQNVSDNLSQKSIHIETLGCRLNQIESESIASFFSNAGFNIIMKSVSASQENRDDVCLCILNTCTVTAKAEQKARRIIRLLLKKYPQSIIAVTGCYAQISPYEIEAIDSRIVSVPGRIKSRFADFPEKLLHASCAEEIKSFLSKEVQLKPVEDKPENPFKLSTDTFLAHSRSSIKIQDGCNNRCSYCEICLARGKSVSLDAQKVIERVKELAKTGQKEIVITTVNIANYKGAYKDGFVDFAGLLKLLLEETQDVAFRFSSLYPQIVTPELAQLIKDPRVRPHFHLSVQSGSDAVLKAMARPYKRQAVIDAVKLLRQVKPQAFFACDIIAGFPGETQSDFEDTLQLLKECNFTYVHAFPFSPRPNTAAWSMKPKVPESVRDERVEQLINFACEQKINYIKNMTGKEFDAIAENSTRAVLSQNVINAVLDNFIHVRVKIPLTLKKPAPGQQIKVRITDVLTEEIKKLGEWEAVGVLV